MVAVSRPSRRSTILIATALLLIISIFGRHSSIAQATSAQPILVVVNSAATTNPFSRYLAEVLRAEGITAFDTVELTNLDSTRLNAAKLVLLTETPLTSGQANMINTYIAGQGKIIAMRPDAQIQSALGVSQYGPSINDGYIAIDTASASGAGFTATTLPLYGAADRYNLASGAATIATLCACPNSPTSYPAIVRYGNTATWAYDPLRSIIYTRQGNPANVNRTIPGISAIRTFGLFYQAIDTQRVSIPHADVQMRLISRMITDILADQMPLPRLWYFPNAKRTMLLLTGDSHGNPISYFTSLINAVENYGGQITIYLSRYSEDPSAAQVAAWRASGHEFGMHPYAYEDGISIAESYQVGQEYFAEQGYGAPSRTVRNHMVEWPNWVDSARTAAGYGIGLDTDFYTWGPAVFTGGTRPNGRPEQAHGYINGSGLPLRFIDENGNVLPIYQQVTSLVDMQLLSGSPDDDPDSTTSENMTASEALAVSRQLIDASQGGDYAAIMTQFHVDYFSINSANRAWANGTMAYARDLGIPRWTAEHWLNFVEARNATQMDNLSWSPAEWKLRFNMTVPAGAEAQSLMLPASYNDRPLIDLRVDGDSASWNQKTITGRATAFANISAGAHNIVAIYSPPPTPTPTDTPTPTATPTPTLTPTATQTATDGPSPTATQTATATATQTATATATQTATATATQTATATATQTATATATQTATATATRTATATATRTATATATRTATAGPMPTATQTATATATPLPARLRSGKVYLPLIMR